MSDYKQRCEQARITKEGDTWKHLKTGKVIRVLDRIGYYGVCLKHESGRITTKLDHYLASEYELITP